MASTDFKWSGEHRSPELESQFREHILPRAIRQTRILAIPISIAVFLGMLLDLSGIGWTGKAAIAIISIRVLTILTLLGLLLAFGTFERALKTAWLPFVAANLVGACLLVETYTQAAGLSVTTPSVITTLLVIYAFLPLPFQQLAAMSLTLTLAYFGILLSQTNHNSQDLLNIPILMLAVNWVGIYNLRATNASARRDLIAENELIRVNNTLIEEMSTRKKAENKATKSEEIFRNVFISCPVPLGLIDLDNNKILQTNDAMTELLKLDPLSLNKYELDTFFADQREIDEFGEILRSPKSSARAELRVRATDGTEYWVLVSAQRFQYMGREAALSSIVDVTENRTRENELRKARLSAENSDATKSQFLATMSHELRTPLNAIIGFSDIMAEQLMGPIGSERYLEYSRHINNSGKHLLMIINDILDLSKIESGKESLMPENLEVRSIMQECVGFFGPKLAEHSIKINTEIVEGAEWLTADPKALKQICLNLLSNAIKFTSDDGAVRVRARPVRDGIAICVEDTGIGIPADQVEKVFEPFHQVEDGYNRTHEGTGLGLPLVKRLVELHHGSVSIESEEGLGTTVTIYIPDLPVGTLLTQSDHTLALGSIWPPY